MLIQNRIQLNEYLENAMTNSYEKIKEEGEYDTYQNLLKTYIIESNVGLNELEKTIKSLGFGVTVTRTEDNTLSVVNIANNNIKVTFFADSFNSRFWLLHTIGNSKSTDGIIRKTVGTQINGLDHPWFSTGFLENIVKNEKDIFRGLTLKYDDIFIKEEDSIPIKSLSMKLWGTAASNVLKSLKSDNDLKNSVSISGIGIKRNFDGNFIIEDIGSWGKFTAKGTSIDGHLQILSELRKKYEETLKFIEDEIFIERKFNGVGYNLRGSSITIVLKKEIKDLDIFLNDLISSKRPFRIWGIKNLIDDEFVKVVGIDLHNNDPLDIEITPNWIRIYMNKGACGNTVMRLLANIQRHYDSEARIEGELSGKII